MPAPQTKYCTDYLIYVFLQTFVTPLMCKYNVHPNMITTFNMLWVVIMFMSYTRRINKYVLLLMMVFYHIMDCLDGDVARKCDKQSFTGLVLDHVSDGTCLLLYLYIMYDLIKKRYNEHLTLYLLVASIVYTCFWLFCIQDMFKMKVDPFFHGKYKNVQVLHDNGVMYHVITWVLIACLMR